MNLTSFPRLLLLAAMLPLLSDPPPCPVLPGSFAYFPFPLTSKLSNFSNHPLFSLLLLPALIKRLTERRNKMLSSPATAAERVGGETKIVGGRRAKG